MDRMDASATKTAFTNNRSVLVNYINASFVDGVISGTVSSESGWDLEKENRYMIFGNDRATEEAYELPVK